MLLIRLLAIVAAAVAVGAASVSSALAVPPCWPDCEFEPPEPPYFETPTGYWDKPGFVDNNTPYDGSDDRLVSTGWALDSDAGANPIYVRLDVYRFDESVWGGRVVFDQSYVVLADRYRADISTTYKAGQNHGYRTEIRMRKSGQIASLLAKVCVTALNVGPGTDAPLYPNYSAFQTSGNCWMNIWLE